MDDVVHCVVCLLCANSLLVRLNDRFPGTQRSLHFHSRCDGVTATKHNYCTSTNAMRFIRVSVCVWEIKTSTNTICDWNAHAKKGRYVWIASRQSSSTRRPYFRTLPLYAVARFKTSAARDDECACAPFCLRSSVWVFVCVRVFVYILCPHPSSSAHRGAPARNSGTCQNQKRRTEQKQQSESEREEREREREETGTIVYRVRTVCIASCAPFWRQATVRSSRGSRLRDGLKFKCHLFDCCAVARIKSVPARSRRLPS